MDSNIYELSIGDRLYIRGTEYNVLGIITYLEKGIQWREFKVKSFTGEVEWLAVEEQGDKASLFKKISLVVNHRNNTLTYKDEVYNQYEKGTAKVKTFSGNVDVDSGELVQYFEYVTQDGKKFFSIEDWDGEVENSIGRPIAVSDIEVYRSTSAQNNSYGAKAGGNRFDSGVGSSRFDNNPSGGIFSNKWAWVAGIVAAILALFGIQGAFGKTVDEYLLKHKDFEYVTSITIEGAAKDQAQVYKTDLTVLQAAKQLKKQKGFEKSSSLSDAEKVSLVFKKQYVFVYTGDDEVTYVQITARKGQEQLKSTSVYHSTRHHSFYRDYYYYRGFSTYYSRRKRDDNSSNGFTSGSARQGSSNTRSSLGGGTSFGK